MTQTHFPVVEDRIDIERDYKRSCGVRGEEIRQLHLLTRVLILWFSNLLRMEVILYECFIFQDQFRMRKCGFSFLYFSLLFSCIYVFIYFAVLKSTYFENLLVNFADAYLNLNDMTVTLTVIIEHFFCGFADLLVVPFKQFHNWCHAHF